MQAFFTPLDPTSQHGEVAPLISLLEGRSSMSSRLVESFINMVRIDSESGQEERFIAYLMGLFEQKLGAHCQRDNYGNLVAKIPARNASSSAPILLGMHADTVKPGKGIEPVLHGGVIRSNGETVLGADDKAACAEVLEAIRTADRFPPLELVVTREEEIGLRGAKNLDYSLLDAKFGFLVDMDAVNAVVVGGPSCIITKVNILGRASHSGMEPEKGISAIRAACDAVCRLKEG